MFWKNFEVWKQILQNFVKIKFIDTETISEKFLVYRRRCHEKTSYV